MAESSVTAVVVTYNRKALLMRCLEALVAQTHPVAAIVIVDNASTDGTAGALEQAGYLPQKVGRLGASTWVEGWVGGGAGRKAETRVLYKQLSSNLGGAGGFHAGVKTARGTRCDWIWMMDDDALPREDALQKLLESSAAKTPGTVVLASCKQNEVGVIQAAHCGTFDPEHGHVELPEERYVEEAVHIDYSSFVGLAVRKSAADRVGLPRADFFISYDDVEYSLRLGEIGKLYLVPESIVVHEDQPSREKTLRAGEVEVSAESIESYWRYLAHFRNKQYVMRTYGNMSVARSVWQLLARLKRIVCLDDHKWLRAKWTILYFLDSFRSEFHSLTPEEWRAIVG